MVIRFQILLVARLADHLDLHVLVYIITVGGHRVAAAAATAIRARVGPALEILHFHLVHHALLALVERDVGDGVCGGRAPAASPALVAAAAERAQVALRFLVGESLLRADGREQRAEDGGEPHLEERENHG